jgi:hypothetical protein
MPVSGGLAGLIEIPGQGGGRTARQLNIFACLDSAGHGSPRASGWATSTADYYHIDGLYWCRPYHLATSFGDPGKRIAAIIENRYAWILSPDHACGYFGWGHDAASVYVGFSNDPAILPCPSSLRRILPSEVKVPGGATYVGLQVPWLVYNPDDGSYPFYLYVEGHAPNGSHQPREEELLFVSNDLIKWIVHGVSHAAASQHGLTAYQTVYRVATGNWISFGAADLTNGRLGNLGVWTSSNGRSFTLDHTIEHRLHNRNFAIRQGAPDLTIGGQVYSVCVERAHDADGGEYVALTPLDAQGNIDPSEPMKIIRLSERYDGLYPGPSYLQGVSAYVEDGICHIYAAHFFQMWGLLGAHYSAMAVA